MSHHCPVCHSSERVHALMEKNGWPLRWCRGCDHIFVSPAPTRQELERIYSFDEGYQKQAMARFSDEDPPAPKLLERLGQIARHVPQGALLDVGCSSGRFLYLAERRGYEVQGVELNHDTAEIARANGLPVVDGDLESAGFPPARFDVVHLGDVIEHVIDPGEMMAHVRKLLAPGGIVVVATPNHAAFFPRATLLLFETAGIPWSHPTPPHHLHQFSFESLSRLLESSGFRIEEARYGPCSLRYELRSTGVFGALKRAWRARRSVETIVRSVQCALVAATYTAIWVVDRCLLRKRRDFDMRVVASVV